jgi:hypothetical protein
MLGCCFRSCCLSAHSSSRRDWFCTVRMAICLSFFPSRFWRPSIRSVCAVMSVSCFSLSCVASLRSLSFSSLFCDAALQCPAARPLWQHSHVLLGQLAIARHLPQAHRQLWPSCLASGWLLAASPGVAAAPILILPQDTQHHIGNTYLMGGSFCLGWLKC